MEVTDGGSTSGEMATSPGPRRVAGCRCRRPRVDAIRQLRILLMPGPTKGAGSARALIIRLPIEASFAQCGTNPQRMKVKSDHPHPRVQWERAASVRCYTAPQSRSLPRILQLLQSTW